MKKLGKLSINVDKIMKNEELVNLRGSGYGYNSLPCSTYVECINYLNVFLGDFCMAPGEDQETAKLACASAYPATMYVRSYDNDDRCCP